MGAHVRETVVLGLLKPAALCCRRNAETLHEGPVRIFASIGAVLRCETLFCPSLVRVLARRALRQESREQPEHRLE